MDVTYVTIVGTGKEGWDALEEARQSLERCANMYRTKPIATHLVGTFDSGTAAAPDERWMTVVRAAFVTKG